jgi:CRP/FNR family transcriptional regulator, dissimilatory nitrate respiration regulator
MDYSILSDCPLFRGLKSNETEEILSEVPFRLKKFAEGALISQSGETVVALMIVLKGILRGEMVDYAGRVIRIEDITAPGALAAAFIFGNSNRFPVNVVAVTDGEIMLVEKGDFLKLLMKNGNVLANFLDMISNRSQFLSEKIKFLSFKTIRGKLAHYLLQRSGNNNSFILNMTQNELADYFGVARPSVGRVLGELEDEGYIEAKGKHILLIDREGLAELTTD